MNFPHPRQQQGFSSGRWGREEWEGRGCASEPGGEGKGVDSYLHWDVKLSRLLILPHGQKQGSAVVPLHLLLIHPWREVLE